MRHELNFLCRGPQEMNATSDARAEEYKSEKQQLSLIRKMNILSESQSAILVPVNYRIGNNIKTHEIDVRRISGNGRILKPSFYDTISSK